MTDTAAKMVLRRTSHLLLTLFVASLPPVLLADECASSSASSVRLSANSYRNMTGHWIAQASLTRRSSRGGSDLRHEERPWRYDVDIVRQSCSDDETMTLAFNVVAPPPRVAADYTFVPNVGYYKLHTDERNWEDARKTCEREGAHLVIVNSEAEAKAIVELMKLYKQENFHAFIGIHDMFTEGQYVTIFGHPLSSTGYVKWFNGEPNNGGGGEDCGDIYSDGSFNDISCARTLPFVCEQSL